MNARNLFAELEWKMLDRRRFKAQSEADANLPPCSLKDKPREGAEGPFLTGLRATAAAARGPKEVSPNPSTACIHLTVLFASV
jgi:hypothetical protein